MSIDLSHLAGILEVSGSLTCFERPERQGMRVVLQIVHKDRTIPDLFAARFGGAVTLTRIGKEQRWSWAKQGKAAQAVLRELHPFMRYRLRPVERILELKISNRGGQRWRPEPGKTVGDELRRLVG